MDILIIGAGLSGAVIAYQAAQAGREVLVIEQRPHVAGHIYDKNVSGVMTHVYGPTFFTLMTRLFTVSWVSFGS